MALYNSHYVYNNKAVFVFLQTEEMLKGKTKIPLTAIHGLEDHRCTVDILANIKKVNCQGVRV